jgi:hypothetical protein
MEAHTAHIRSLARETDDAGRQRMLKDLQDLQLELEGPIDLFLRLYNSVSYSRGSLRCVAATVTLCWS